VVPQLDEALRRKAGGLRFDLSYGTIPSLLLLFSSSGSIQPLSEMSTKKFHPDKLRVARTAEDCAVLVVSNVKVRMEVK